VPHSDKSHYAPHIAVWPIHYLPLLQDEFLPRGIRLIREETIANILHAKYVLVVPEFKTGYYVNITDAFSERWQRSAYL
jgi:hypothetical protein